MAATALASLATGSAGVASTLVDLGRNRNEAAASGWNNISLENSAATDPASVPLSHVNSPDVSSCVSLVAISLLRDLGQRGSSGSAANISATTLVGPTEINYPTSAQNRMHYNTNRSGRWRGHFSSRRPVIIGVPTGSGSALLQEHEVS